LSGEGNKSGGVGYRTVKPEMIDLGENLNNLGIDQDQLIALGILIGTDYNPGGVKGIGPKTGLKLVKQFGKDFKGLFSEVKFDEHSDYDWKHVYDHFKKMPVTKKYSLQWKGVKKDNIISFLVDTHEFSQDRVMSSLGNLTKEAEKRKQKTLGDF